MLRFTEAPIINSVNPSFVPCGISTSIAVKGVNFYESPQLRCHFGDQYGMTPVEWLSSELLICKTPVFHGDSEVKVSVTNNEGYHTSAAHKLKIKPRFQLLSFAPTDGFAAGENTIMAQIGGLSLQSIYECTVGSLTVRAKIKNNQSGSSSGWVSRHLLGTEIG